MCHTNATMVPWSMRRDCMVLFARRLQEDRLVMNRSPGSWFLQAFQSPMSHQILAHQIGRGLTVFTGLLTSGKATDLECDCCPLAAAAREANSAAERAAARKSAKYVDIESDYIFQYSRQWPFNLWVQLTSLVALFCTNVVASFLFIQAMTGKPFLARPALKCRRAYILPLRFFLSFFFFRRLISKVARKCLLGTH